MIEKWREVLDNFGETGAVLTNLFKTCDSINHNLPIAEFNAYGDKKSSHDFIHSYLSKKIKDKNRVIF